MNFKVIEITGKLFKLSGSALNTVHFADGNFAISDIKIKNLEFKQGIYSINGINVMAGNPF